MGHQSLHNNFRMSRVSLLVVCFLSAVGSSTKVERQPKLFFVSTSATTTTLQTASICYVTSGATIGTCSGRRRRSVKIDGAQLADVSPSQLNHDVQSSQKA